MKKFDIHSINHKINHYLSPQAMGDFNKFLEEMPARAGKAALILAGAMWFLAGLAVVYATTVASDVANIRTELVKSEALKPVVPRLVKTPVDNKSVQGFADRVNPLYRDVAITAEKGIISITSSDGRYFGAFREAINHAYNGGQRWRLDLKSLCVGRECSNGTFLTGKFSVNTLKIER